MINLFSFIPEILILSLILISLLIGLFYKSSKNILTGINSIGFLFIAYLFIWFKSWTRTRIVLFEAQKNGLINKEQLNFLLYSIYLTFAFYVGTEASSTRSFLLLVIISLLPDYISYNLSKTRIKIEK